MAHQQQPIRKVQWPVTSGLQPVYSALATRAREHSGAHFSKASGYEQRPAIIAFVRKFSPAANIDRVDIVIVETLA